MIRLLWLATFNLLCIALSAQGFEVLVSHESIKGLIGENIKTPVRFKNSSDKAITVVVKKVNTHTGSSKSVLTRKMIVKN